MCAPTFLRWFFGFWKWLLRGRVLQEDPPGPGDFPSWEGRDRIGAQADARGNPDFLTLSLSKGEDGRIPQAADGERTMIEGSCHCGKVKWTFDVEPKTATTCNCTVCRRWGVLWAYDLVGDRTKVTGETRAYVREGGRVGFHFCTDCGSIVCYRALKPDAEGKRRTAVNLRMADPDVVAKLPIHKFEGLDTFTSLGQDGRLVGDVWF